MFIRIKVHTDSETVMQDQTVDQQVYRVEQVEEVFEEIPRFPLYRLIGMKARQAGLPTGGSGRKPGYREISDRGTGRVTGSG